MPGQCSHSRNKGSHAPLKRANLCVVILSAILASCATTTDTDAIEPLAVCGAWRSISWSELDTDRTILEVKLNNVARSAWGCVDNGG